MGYCWARFSGLTVQEFGRRKVLKRPVNPFTYSHPPFSPYFMRHEGGIVFRKHLENLKKRSEMRSVKSRAHTQGSAQRDQDCRKRCRSRFRLTSRVDLLYPCARRNRRRVWSVEPRGRKKSIKISTRMVIAPLSAFLVPRPFRDLAWFTLKNLRSLAALCSSVNPRDPVSICSSLIHSHVCP